MGIRKILVAVGVWIVVITSAHAWLNINWGVVMNQWLPLDKRKLNVAFIPVT